MSLKILFVGSSQNDKGGIVTVMDNIRDYFYNSEVNIETVPTYITGSFQKRIGIFIKGLITLLFKLVTNRPDLIHIHMAHGGSFYRKSIIILIAKLFNVPVITHIHSSSFKDFYKGLNRFFKKYCQVILGLNSCVIVLSKEWEQYFSRILKKTVIKTLYNGVEVHDSFITDRKNGEMINCLFLGRLSDRKGIYDLINAIKVISSEDNRINFILAGDGETEKVKNIVQENNLEDFVEITGWVNKETRHALLLKSEVLILPSYNEGLPMAILEAMSYGLSIISTPVGGIPEAVKHGENGYLINPGDVDGMVKFLSLLANDHVLRNQFSVNNREKIMDKFNSEKLFKTLKLIYNDYSK